MLGRLFILGLMALNLNSCHTFLYDRQLRLLYKNTVPVIEPNQLQSYIAQEPNICLLDTRTEREFAVSHIAGARAIDYKTFNLNSVKDIPLAAPVVVYCTVGVRSERVGEQLQKAGYTRVYNLYGGIFNWKNKGLPLVDFKQNPTNQIHSYNRYWAIWLQNGIKVYE